MRAAEAVAGLATYLRREWGHEESAVEPSVVARVRKASADRAETAKVDNCLSRFALPQVGHAGRRPAVTSVSNGWAQSRQRYS